MYSRQMTKTYGVRSAVALAALFVTAGSALAGGFAVREQSASLMGAAFAGAAAGGDLSSSFWNPAAFSVAGDGLQTQSAYSAILADTELSNGTTSAGPIGATGTSIDKIGVLSASYAAYRMNEKLVLGVSVNTPFGLATDPDNLDWTGRVHSREAQMLSFNVAPTIAYDIAPGITIAAGIQLEYMKLKLWSAALPTLPSPSVSIKVDDNIGVGATAGILLRPAAGTSIGLGFRSSIEHDLKGNLFSPTGATPAVSATLETPEMVTFSFSQAVTTGVRLLGTVEWSNWSRIDVVPLVGLGGPAIDAKWDDGWLVSGGLEYDYSGALTLRGGLGYEKSPIRNPAQRLVQLPDSDRIWVAAGASYRYSESTTLDFSYAHLFFDDAHLTRGALTNPAFVLDADVSNSADILSVGMRTRW
ncbi:MAG: outer membrane protein transport protein [Hyphomicrobium sp.]